MGHTLEPTVLLYYRCMPHTTLPTCCLSATRYIPSHLQYAQAARATPRPSSPFASSPLYCYLPTLVHCARLVY